MSAAFTAFAADVTVFAAASTTDAVNEIIAEFEAETGKEITASFASSGTLAKQIDNSAPADIFISANVKWMDWLIEKNKIEKDTAGPLLANRLALIAPSASPVSPEELTNEKAVEFISSAERVAIGDPAHVPAGMYAKKTMENLGVWGKVEKTAARMQNVRLALAMVEKNAVPLGIVYSSDAAQSSMIKVIGLFSEDLHGAIRYPAGIVKERATEDVKAFFEYLKSDTSAAIFKKYGFGTVY